MAQNKKLREEVGELKREVGELHEYQNALDAKVGRLTAQLAHLGETLAAAVSVAGEDKVVAEMSRLRTERQKKLEEKQAEGVKVMVEQNVLVPAETVTGVENFLVITDIDEKGHETRAQFEMSILEPAAQLKWVGKKAGDEVTVQGRKGKAVVREVYTVNAKAVAEDVLRRAEAAKQTPAAPATA